MISRRALFLLIFTLLAIIATLFLRDSVREYLAVPFISGSRWIYRLARSIDPDIFWGVFILVIYVVILFSFPTLAGLRRLNRQPPISQTTADAGGRLQFWRAEVQQLSNQTSFTRYSVIELRKLALNVIAFHQQCSLGQAEDWLVEHAWKAPEELLELIRPESQDLNQPTLDKTAQEQPKSRLWLSWRELLKSVLGISTHPPKNDKVEIILLYLEELLEVKHDHSQ